MLVRRQGLRVFPLAAFAAGSSNNGDVIQSRHVRPSKRGAIRPKDQRRNILLDLAAPNAPRGSCSELTGSVVPASNDGANKFSFRLLSQPFSDMWP